MAAYLYWSDHQAKRNVPSEFTFTADPGPCYRSGMFEVKIKGHDPRGLAELIVTTVYERPVTSELAGAASVFRAHKELVDGQRATANELETVNFTKLDPETDWTEV